MHSTKPSSVLAAVFYLSSDNLLSGLLFPFCNSLCYVTFPSHSSHFPTYYQVLSTYYQPISGIILVLLLSLTNTTEIKYTYSPTVIGVYFLVLITNMVFQGHL